MMPMPFPETVAVLGLGVSGCAVAEALLRRGIRVLSADEADLDKLRYRERVLKMVKEGLELVLGQGAFFRVREMRPPLAILSPGISVHRDDIQALHLAGTELWGELEFGYRLLCDEYGREKVQLLAVTGTKGKTTTVHLIDAMLKASGLPTVLGGNVGEPLTDLVAHLPRDLVNPPLRLVLEASSFQLATTKTFRPDVAGVTTLFVDHMDWHKSVKDYWEAKARIFVNQKGSDWAVLNADNAGVRWLAQFVKGRILWCGREVYRSCPYCTHWVSDDGDILWAALGGERFPVARLSLFPLRGEHNLQNLRVAVGVALLAGARPDTIAEVSAQFKGVPHRLELVGEIDGVRFVNDSAATMPDAAAAGIRSFEAPIVLIAGGLDKGGDWREFLAALKERVKALVVMGEFADTLAAMARQVGVPKIVKVGSMDEAVQQAASLAAPGDVVLLSPGCASFDMFANYAQRGEAFKQAVGRLAENAQNRTNA